MALTPEYTEQHNSPDGRVDITDFHQNEYSQLTALRDETDLAVSKIISGNQAFSRFEQSLSDRAQRLIQVIEETLQPQYEVICSIVTHSAFYLKLHAELQRHGATDDEVGTFFLSALADYSRYASYYNSPGNLVRRIHRRTRVGDMKVAPIGIIEKIPRWFSGSKKEWEQYLYTIMDIDTFLHDGDPSVHDFDEETTLEEIFDRCYSHELRPDAEPKWLSEFRQDPSLQPSLARVREEHDEDNQERLFIQDRFLSAEQQRTDLRQMYVDKDTRALTYLERISQSLWANANRDLRSLILTIGAIDSLPRSADVLASIRGNFVGRFFQQHVLDPSITALWYEKALKQGDTTPELMKTALQISLDPAVSLRILKEIQAENKKHYRFIRNSLLPLTRFFTPDEVAYLQECMDGTMPQPEWLHEFTGLIASKRDAIYPMEGYPDRDTGKITIDITTFGLHYILDHYQDLYRRLRARLDAQPAQPGSAASLSSHSVPPASELLLAADDVPVSQGEVAAATQGPLHGWKIQYIQKHESRDARELIPIEGETIEELEQALLNFIGREKIPFTIRGSSLVHVLESIVSRDPELDKKTPLLNRRYSNVEYKKERLGKRQRLLYRLNRETQELIFFLTLKKKYTYDL